MLHLTNEDNMELMARYPDKYFDLAVCELDKEYFDKGIERVKNHLKQVQLFREPIELKLTF